MEVEILKEFPHSRTADVRPRKRARSGWDVDPLTAAKAQMGILCGQEVNVKSITSSETTFNDTCSSQYAKDFGRQLSPPWRGDDKDGHYKFEIGENLTSRYKIHSKMGEGTFGQVLECWDQERNDMVAIKIVRSNRKYRQDAMIEIDILQRLGKHDNASRSHPVKDLTSRCYQNQVLSRLLILEVQLMIP